MNKAQFGQGRQPVGNDSSAVFAGPFNGEARVRATAAAGAAAAASSRCCPMRVFIFILLDPSRCAAARLFLLFLIDRCAVPCPVVV